MCDIIYLPKWTVFFCWSLIHLLFVEASHLTSLRLSYLLNPPSPSSPHPILRLFLTSFPCSCQPYPLPPLSQNPPPRSPILSFPVFSVIVNFVIYNISSSNRVGGSVSFWEQNQRSTHRILGEHILALFTILERWKDKFAVNVPMTVSRMKPSCFENNILNEINLHNQHLNTLNLTFFCLLVHVW